MPKLNKSWIHQRWKQFRQISLAWGSNQRAPLRWSFRNLLRTRSEHLVSWLWPSQQYQHCGPKARIPELFQRRDIVFYALRSGRLQMKAAPPARYYDLLDATARVGALEMRLGYTFNNRLTCIAALKPFNDGLPLYHDGITHVVDKNNRLALLGDRVINLFVCQIWFQTEHSNSEHAIMSAETVSRIALEATGNALGLRRSILVPNEPLQSTQMKLTRDHIAETFEAILGAIYVDSGYDLQPVSKDLKRLRLNNQRFLKSRIEQATKDKQYEATPITTQCPSVRDISAKISTPRRGSDASASLGRRLSAKVSSVLEVHVPNPGKIVCTSVSKYIPNERQVQGQITDLKKRISGAGPYKAELFKKALRLHAAQVATGDHTTPFNILARLFRAVGDQTAREDANVNQKAQAAEELENARHIKAENIRRKVEPAKMYAAAEMARKKSTRRK